jgi:phospholipase/carboxylesterase
MQPQVQVEQNSQLEFLKVDNQSQTVICLFHGYGASMQDLYGLAQAMPIIESVDWVFPNGPLELNMGMGMMSRAWFPIDMQALELAMQNGEHRDLSGLYPTEFEHALAMAKKFIEYLKQKYQNIIIGGFSQGAMLSTHLSLQNSEDVLALLCLSGNFIGKEQVLKLTERSYKFPFFQSHGKVDPVLGYANACELFEALKLGGHQGEFVGFQGAHEIPMQVITKATDFINKLKRR